MRGVRIVKVCYDVSEAEATAARIKREYGLETDRTPFLESQRVTKELQFASLHERQKELTIKIAAAARVFLSAYDDPDCDPAVGTESLADLIELIVRPRSEEVIKSIRRASRNKEL